MSNQANKRVDQEIFNQLHAALKLNEMRLEKEQICKIVKYINLLKTHNKIHNLTAITETAKIIHYHIIDSLTTLKTLQCLVTTIDLYKQKSPLLIDLGSGAGLPGVPLSVAWPEQKIMLLEKKHKKILFLQCVITELELANTETMHYSAYYAMMLLQPVIFVSRATASPCNFVKLLPRYLAKDTVVVMQQSNKEKLNLNVGDLIDNYKIRDVIKINVAEVIKERCLLVMQKT